MRYAVFEIASYSSYGITIGSRVKPDSQFREQVVSQIDKAMEALERDKGQTHKVAIVPDLDLEQSSQFGMTEIGVPGIPYLFPGKQYLIFSLFYSNVDSREALSDSELESYRGELEAMLEGFMDSVRAALVLLQDCSVSVIESRKTEDGNSRERASWPRGRS